MTERETLKLALEALEEAADAIDSWGSYASGYFQVKHDLEGDISKAKSAIAAMKEALAQPEQEPFAFLHPQKGFYFAKPTKILAPTIVDVEPLALYTTPSLHKPLSDEKLKKIWYDMENIMGWYSFQEIAQAIEAAHGIKGEA